MKDKKRFFGLIEAVFDAAYLCAVFIMGIYILAHASSFVRLLCGITALTLVGGDSFHLVPRIASIARNDKERYRAALGRGKFITSITMTVFYVLLWHIAMLLFSPEGMGMWTVVIYALAALRIALCCLPQNRWLEQNPPVRWGVYRNIPFLIMGIMTIILYAVYGAGVPAVRYMWLAVALSFAFYLPVVTGAQKNPRLGMLMLPKSCAYVWIVAMLLAL